VWKGEAAELWVKRCALLLAMSLPGIFRKEAVVMQQKTWRVVEQTCYIPAQELEQF
jgi:hypothetical protein